MESLPNSMINPHTRSMTLTTGIPRSLLAAFRQSYPGHTPDVFVRAPGCVNLLGGHVDIQDGMVINIALNREIWVAASYGSADMVQLNAADLDESVALSLKRLDDRSDILGQPLPHWAWYPAGIAWALQRRGLNLNGIDAVFMGDVWMRAGLGSSAAIEIGFAIAWQALEGWRLEPAELARVGREVERDYMAVGSGIQDQFTCLHAQSDQVLWLDCRTLEFRHLSLPPTVRVMVCDTNTRRALAGSGYGERAMDCHAAAHTISLVDRHVKLLRDVTLDRLETFRSLLTESQFRRSRHVITEIARVQRGAAALERGDVAEFGALMNESYWSARDDYGSSSAALDAMWKVVNDHPGCYGARYSGGGEAGAVVALVAADRVDDFITHTESCYHQMTGSAANIFAAEPAGAAGVFI
jgi:galactokinase